MNKFKNGDFVVTTIGIVIIKNEFSENDYSTYLRYNPKDDYISFTGEVFSSYAFIRYANEDEIKHIYELLDRETYNIDFDKKEITNSLKIGEAYIFWDEYKNYIISILDYIEKTSIHSKYRDINGKWHLNLMKFESVEQYKGLFKQNNKSLFTIGKQYGDTIYLPLTLGYHIGQMKDDKIADGHIKRLFKQGSGKYIKTYAKNYAFVDCNGIIKQIIQLDENYTFIVKETNEEIFVKL